MGRLVEVKEFDSIIAKRGDNDSQAIDGFKCLNKDEFEELTAFIKEFTSTEEESDTLDFMKIGYRRSVGDIVTVKNYVGLIELEKGFQLQILPKIRLDDAGVDGDKRTKQIFIKMLRSMKDFPCKVFSDASLNVDRMNLYEIFINMYLQEARQLVKHGIRSSYVRQEENLNYYKGKLLIKNHIKENLTHKERFYVSFDEFHPNRPENRLIKSTLIKLQKKTTSMENSKEIRQLLTAFEMVEPSINYEKDFSKVMIDRNTKDYEMLMQWSKVFLLDKSFSSFSGKTASKALLFPMEKVYESYVAQEMKKKFMPDGWMVSSQDGGHYLFDRPRNQFALRPDIVMRRGNKTIILDTKWKNLFDKERKNYGISQADMYQMYAYSKKYSTPDIWLLYPQNDEMKGHPPISFSSGEETHVNIHFVDLENIDNNLDELREKIYK